MSASPPAAQGSSNTSVPNDSVPQPPPPNGQDHNAMETDEESDHYDDSEGDDDEEDDDEEEHPPEEGQAPSNGVDQVAHMEDSMMDFSTELPPPPTQEAAPAAVDQASQTTPAPPVAHFAGDGAAPAAVALSNSWGTNMPSLIPEGGAQVQIQVDAELLALEAATRRSETPHEGRRSPLRDRPDLTRQSGRRDGRPDDDDDGSDSDESMDEPDHPYWAHFKPDTSLPDENETSAIEEADEVLATDHEHWEKSTFEPLDDPEYIPSDVGRITWTLTGHHGTPENPNREEVIRSPSTLIGGLYWNVKYYPRGNDGTDYMSVYIECSPRPYEETLKHQKKEIEASLNESIEEKIPVENGNANGAGENGAPGNSEPVNGTAVNGGEAAVELASVLEQMNGAEASHTPEVDMDASMVLPSDSVLVEEVEEIVEERPWSVAAQVACVIYNPEEPR